MSPDIERAAYRCIRSEAEKLKCVVLAIGGMPDHVHLVVQVPTNTSATMLAKHAKGVTSAMLNDQYHSPIPFEWQEGFDVFSMSSDHINQVIGYVKNQKQLHAQNTHHYEWEEADEEAPGTASGILIERDIA